ncbi:MAG: repressor LexA [Acidobacteria bacterium]|nr:transcriptional repressor LexA [Acidobacteriota bacterium]MCB9399047.1 repressor LexA [Acidobacteriota bacterium]
MRSRLNPTQQKIYEYLCHCQEQGERFPSGAELGERFGMSQQAIWKNLKVLERLGFLEKEPNRARALRPVLPQDSHSVPLLGRIAAGRPIEALELPQHLPLGDMLPPAEGYALQVEGDSMIEDGIHEGDIVIIRRQNHAFNGQTVVAIVNGEATLKRYYHEGSQIRLQPANASMQPIWVGPETPFEIRGIVHALLRRF